MTTGEVLRAWMFVYVGNAIGAVSLAVMVFLSGQYAFGGGAIGVTALRIAEAKAGLGFTQAFFLGHLCNALANLVPVTLGNIVGGVSGVGAVYWFVYLRKRRSGADA